MKSSPRNLLLVLAGAIAPTVVLQAFLVFDTHSTLDKIKGAVAGTPFADQAGNVHEVFVEITLIGILTVLLVGFAGYVVSRFILEQAADHARAHDDLARSNARLESLVDAIPDAVYFKDLEGHHLFFNKASEELTGRPRSELVGRTAFELMPPEAAEVCRRSDAEVIESRHAVRTEEVATGPDGSRSYFETIKAPILDPTGEVAGLVGVSRNVTDHRRLEEELRQAQKMEAIGRLAGGVAHDINNFLAAVTGYCDQIRLTHSGDGALVARIDSITRIAGNAAAVVRQLLAFSRKQPMRLEPLNLNSVVQETAKMLDRLLDAGIVLEIFLEDGLWAARCDRIQIEQVLMNLAVNAKDAMADKGKLTIETANATIHAGNAERHPFVVPGDYAVITVADTGHGMTPEVRERIFEPFFTTKEGSRGTGLGLSTVYGIVKQHRGYILVFSEPGKGSRFRIYLPRCVEGAETGARDSEVIVAPEPSAPSTGTRILLIEDNDDVRGAVQALMSAMGYEVDAAASGEEGLRIFDRERGRFSLVVTDVVMPGMRGDEFAVRLRERDPGIRILFISGYTEQAISRQGTLAESVDFLQKPFTAAVLGRKLRDLIR